jgi:hypothetical protein
MNRPGIRVFVPETAVYVEGFAAHVISVGLGQMPNSAEHRVFILLAPPDAPERGTLFQVDIEDVVFLRDAIDTVLERHRAITGNAN